jgi:hypothetical protein
MNARTLDFTQRIRTHIDALESARSRLEGDALGSADPALNAARDAFATIDNFLQTSIRDEE